MQQRKIFTPEVIASIPGMLEDGMTPGEIAAKLGCTRSTFMVRCSRHKIPTRRNGDGVLMPRTKEARKPYRKLTLSKKTSLVMREQAQQRALDINEFAARLLETIVRDNLINAVLDDMESV